MEILITDDKTVAAVQQEFNEKFPHLKIEFYNRAHEFGEGSPEKYKLEGTATIGDIRTKHKEGGLSIHGNQQTKTLEARFEEVYGLNIQVFRKSGKVWLQTTSTDNWTLSHQELAGERHDK